MPLTVLLATEACHWPGATAVPPAHLVPAGTDPRDVASNPLECALGGETPLDAARGAAASADPVMVAVSARHFSWFASWASAHGIQQVALLNTGASAVDGSDQLAPEALLAACCRHAIGPMGLDTATAFPVTVKAVLDPSGHAATVAEFTHDALHAASLVLAPMLAAAQESLRCPESRIGTAAENEAWVRRVEASDSSVRAAFSFARVGLMGNPSDQLHGKSVAVTVDNFGARVTVRPSKLLRIAQHPIADQTAYGGLDDVATTVTRNGYSGGMRLVLAAVKRFRLMALAEGLCDAETLRRNFTLTYDTNVPRQVGLAGSSCIVSAIFKALAKFYGVTMNLDTAPSAVLAAEWEELGIHAGLMDRVSQLWGGFVRMDFEKAFVEAHGHGRYERLPVATLPPLYLAYAMDPSDSGRIHNDVKQRYFKGDEEVVAASRRWAGFVDDACAALQGGDHATFVRLVDENFDLRRQLYGDPCLGAKNLHMVEIARRHNAAAKFPGSGGAILVVPKPGVAADSDIEAMREEMEDHGFVLVRLRPVDAPPS